MLLPLISSLTFSFAGWLFLWCWYQGPVAGGVGCLRVLGTYGMHPERCISVLSRWSLWVWDWFGCYRGGTGTLSSPSCCYLRAEPSDPPVAHGILCAAGFCVLQMAGGCIWESHFCLCFTCKMELDLESFHKVDLWKEKDSLAGWEHSRSRQPSASLLNHHHHPSGLNAADLTLVFTMKFWRAEPSERLNAVLLNYTLVKYSSALNKHYK